MVAWYGLLLDPRLHRRGHIGQKNRAAGAVALRVSPAAQAKFTLMFLHDPLAHPQSQTGALGILGGEEGFEDARHVFRGNAATIVSHGDVNPGATLAVVPLFHANLNIARR